MYNNNTHYLSQTDMPLADIGNDRVARVLLIEDDRTIRRMVSKSLRDHCELLEAPDASQGISTYNAFEPDLIFMDIELPDGDGQHLLEWITRNDPGAFVVMFSGHSDNNHVVDSIEAGARGFISKPFDLNKMLHFIRMCPKLH